MQYLFYTKYQSGDGSKTNSNLNVKNVQTSDGIDMSSGDHFRGNLLHKSVLGFARYSNVGQN